jgi:hypothetical protein
MQRLWTGFRADDPGEGAQPVTCALRDDVGVFDGRSACSCGSARVVALPDGWTGCRRCGQRRPPGGR